MCQDLFYNIMNRQYIILKNTLFKQKFRIYFKNFCQKNFYKNKMPLELIHRQKIKIIPLTILLFTIHKK